MLTEDILARRDIKPVSKVVFATMRMKSKGRGGLTISHTALAIASGISRTHVLDSLKELENVKLIERDGGPIRQVQPYRIMCDQVVEEKEIAEAPVTVRKVQLRPCLKCRKQCVPSRANGWCRKCTADVHVTKVATRAAAIEVDRKLGSREQIA